MLFKLYEKAKAYFSVDPASCKKASYSTQSLLEALVPLFPDKSLRVNEEVFCGVDAFGRGTKELSFYVFDHRTTAFKSTEIATAKSGVREGQHRCPSSPRPAATETVVERTALQIKYPLQLQVRYVYSFS